VEGRGTAGLDPRLFVLERRLSGVKRVVAVASGKGGVGKTLVASTAALALAWAGRSVGLLDLDMHGPSCHVVLGIEEPRVVEDRGVVPIDACGVKLMSLFLFAGDADLPLRGRDLTDVALELLAVTRWGDLDLLLIDMPPGTGDEILDVMNFIRRAEFLVVTTPSALSLMTVRRLLSMLSRRRAPVLGLVENMVSEEPKAEALAREAGVRYLGWLPADPLVERCLGNPDQLLQTDFARALTRVLRSLGWVS